MAARKNLKTKLEEITAEEAETIAAMRRKFSGRRAAEILKATTADLLEAGITNPAEHPDMRVALGGSAAEEKPGKAVR